MRSVEADTLRLLSDMPLIDRLEMVSVSGWSRGAVYRAVESLEGEGLAASVLHASELTAATRRYCLTAGGLHVLAREEGVDQDEPLRSRPVSAHWQRLLMARLDAVAVIYRLASAISDIAHPIRFRWYRALPIDAAVALPNGRTLGIVRQGPTSDRTGFAKRLWRLREGPQPGCILMLSPDEVRLRYARRLMTGAPAITFLAMEKDAALAEDGARVWRTPSASVALDLSEALSHARRRGEWAVERPLTRSTPPQPIGPGSPRRRSPDWLLPTVLKPAEKRALDLLADWPWITLGHLAGLLGVSGSRASQLVMRLEGLGLLTRVLFEGRRRHALTDRGLALLARRDRASVGAAKRRWSASRSDPRAPLAWRNVTGRRSRQLLRNLDHTDAVHAFIAALATQSRSLGWDLAQLDPPMRAARHFRHRDGLRSVHADAFGILRRGPNTWPFFLEWERRAVRPSTMAQRLAPYLRYYSSHRPTDDHGAQPAVLVVFDDELAATHFLHVAGEEMDRAGVEVPLLVSHEELLEREGPLGRAWMAPGGGWKPVRALPDYSENNGG